MRKSQFSVHPSFFIFHAKAMCLNKKMMQLGHQVDFLPYGWQVWKLDSFDNQNEPWSSLIWFSVTIMSPRHAFANRNISRGFIGKLRLRGSFLHWCWRLQFCDGVFDAQLDVKSRWASSKRENITKKLLQLTQLFPFLGWGTNSVHHRNNEHVYFCPWMS